MIRATTSLLVTLAAFVAFALPADARAATNHATSSNWAGYAASGSGVRFRSVAASWVQPAATCTAGERRYSAYWIGLGGMHSTSTALEQIGTQVDCSSTGHPVYSAWYELVPAGPVSVHLAVNPGDKLSAKVTVSRGRVKLHLANRTRGTAFTTTRRLPAKRLDVSSAEWIVEAPSACDASGCHTLPLANFGSASFTGARATNVAGRTGPIAHPAWSATAIDLSPGGGDGSLPTGLAVDSSVAGATPSGLSAGGDAFTVTYNGAPAPTTAPAPAPEPVPPAPEPTPVPASPAPSTPAPASPAPAPIPLPTLPLPLPVAPASPPAGSPGA
jgi:hypothetical protein